MKDRKNTFQFVNKSAKINNKNSNSNSNKENDVILLDSKSEEEETVVNTKTTTNNHVTKRRKNNMTDSNNNNNNDDTTTTKDIDKVNNNNSATDQLQQRKRSSASTSSNQLNNNNKRVINFEEDDNQEDVKRSYLLYFKVKKQVENELKSKLKKDLLLICKRLNVTATMNQTKDTIIQNILKIPNDRLSFIIIDNNPLQVYNKGSLEYSLPWPIISRILDLVWTDASICTCYYSEQLFISLVSKGPRSLFDHFQMYPIYQQLMDVYKESRMKCPMHAYYYLNGLYPPVNIAISTPFYSEFRNDKNRWRFKLLTLSKRVNQYLSSNHFTNVKLSFNQDLWNHVNNQYCPIKTPKKLTLDKHHQLQLFSNRNSMLFSKVEKLSIFYTPGSKEIPQPVFNNIQSLFKNIKSLTLKFYIKYEVSVLSQFKNLTSLNLEHPPHLCNDRQQLLDVLQPGMIKLLLPSQWCTEPITLGTKLANTIQISNITPPNQMPNLHTFYTPYASYGISSFYHPNVTKLVEYYTRPKYGSPLLPIILHPSIETLKIGSKEDHFYRVEINVLFDRLNVKNLILFYYPDISDKIINDFKRHGYEYKGSVFKGPTKRKLHFIKTTTPTPEITPKISRIQTWIVINVASTPITIPRTAFFLSMNNETMKERSSNNDDNIDEMLSFSKDHLKTEEEAQHITKRRKSNINTMDSTTDKVNNDDSRKDIDQFSSSTSHQLNINNKRVINFEEDENNQDVKQQQNERSITKRSISIKNIMIDYSKGSLEYSLPWSIVSRILDQLWIESSICTCYYSHQLIDTLKSQPDGGVYSPFDYYQMWPVYQPLMDIHKESRMKCPMHAYYYLNGLYPSINISAPFVSELNNDKNHWRFKLLELSKRINLYLSSNHLTNVRLSINQDLWNHINNQYLPIKALKRLTINLTCTPENFVNTSIFFSVEKLSIDGNRDISPKFLRNLQSVFKNIKSFTFKIFSKFNCNLQSLFQFNNLTSINLTFPPHNSHRQQLLDILQPGIIKLLLPGCWCTQPITLKAILANTIQVSNISPPKQMPNLHTFYTPSSSYDISSFDHLNVTRIVDQPYDLQSLPPIIAPSTIETLKFSANPNPNLFLDVNSIIQTPGLLDQLNVKKLILYCHLEISDKTINSFKRHGYEYQGAIFKGPLKRQLHFIKITKPTPEIIIETTLETVVHKPTEINNPTLPYYLIEKIVRYSWNSYRCTCDIEGELVDQSNQPQFQMGDYIKQSQKFLKAKSMCPMHKHRLPYIRIYKGESVIRQINQLRFGIPTSCKRLFSFVSKYLVNSSWIPLQESEISNRHQHYSNPYCLFGKSIETLTIEISHTINKRKSWRFLNLNHYSNLKSLKFAPVGTNQFSLPCIHKLLSQSGRLQSITSLDLSISKLDTISGLSISSLKNLPLRKLYYVFKENQFLFQQQNSEDDDSSKWPITQSLESVSINSFDVIPKLDRLPKLRHLRIIIDSGHGFNVNIEFSEQQMKSILPSNVTKLSFVNTNIANMCQHNPQQLSIHWGLLQMRPNSSQWHNAQMDIFEKE
ncbi:hypothetical protein DFA_00095 [Cavenderia fasciculata]|uniref:Uncharacterized protein n=1 Tax=Cavenderia fasciculata TaxID=261658 RepID=F4PXK7_CACFS|nr:uncharacterized protein DFA_00095 [Cavenderia fasciculata]EGG19517.1 hypothetical protein DFA_00095 [Cavenderia fasciculata]|eukprot:XP_004357811.1 hypothetical protein DFA_00095 [Cavenderia fasciculata]